MLDKQLSICMLLYGDHTNLAARLLDSLIPVIDTCRNIIKDIRIALNEVSPQTEKEAVNWIYETMETCPSASEMSLAKEDSSFKQRIVRDRFPIYVLQTDKNAFKYPLMRQMFHGANIPSLGKYMFWLDDDAHFEEDPGWSMAALPELLKPLYEDRADVVGYGRIIPVQKGRWEFVKTQPWYNPKVGPPPKRRNRSVFRFAQGSAWITRSDLLTKHNWPIPELKHNGGDQLFGEMCRHQGYRFEQAPSPRSSQQSLEYVYCNSALGAEENLEPSTGTDLSERREQANSKNLGTGFKPGDRLTTDHQEFDYKLIKYDYQNVDNLMSPKVIFTEEYVHAT